MPSFKLQAPLCPVNRLRPTFLHYLLEGRSLGLGLALGLGLGLGLALGLGLGLGLALGLGFHDFKGNSALSYTTLYLECQISRQIPL